MLENYHIVSWSGAMLSLVFFKGCVEVVAPAVVDVERANVRLGLRPDHLSDDLEVSAKCANT